MKGSITRTSEILSVVDVARLVREDFRKRAGHTKLSQPQWRIMLCLLRSPGITPSALALTLEVSPVTVTQSVNRLINAGWVNKTRQLNDRRVVSLELTAKAKPIVGELNDIAETMHRELFAGFTASEKRQLKQLMEKLKANLSASLENHRSSGKNGR